MPSLRPSQRPARRPALCPALRPVLCPALAAAVLAAGLAAGCAPRLAERHEYFSRSGSASDAETAAVLVRYGALQEAQHACAAVPVYAVRALLCPDPARLPAVRGAISNAYRRWANDAVRDLPPISATAQGAAGG